MTNETGVSPREMEKRRRWRRGGGVASSPRGVSHVYDVRRTSILPVLRVIFTIDEEIHSAHRNDTVTCSRPKLACILKDEKTHCVSKRVREITVKSGENNCNHKMHGERRDGQKEEQTHLDAISTGRDRCVAFWMTKKSLLTISIT